MINLLEAEKSFKKYLSSYDASDGNIELKIRHTYGVVRTSEYITKGLELDEEDIQLAKLIALLHDIGRFEQIRRFHTFVDKDSINHGEYGVKVLFEDGLIRDFIKDEKYDEIIKLSILNHNIAKIEKGLTEKQNLHAKIIRDADKTDIFYVLTIGDKKAIWEKEDLSNDKITDEIYREFIEEKYIDYKKRETSADFLVSHFAYVYDFNFNQSLKIIKENNYIDKLYKRHTFNDEETMKRYNNIYEIAKKYLKNRSEMLD